MEILQRTSGVPGTAGIACRAATRRGNVDRRREAGSQGFPRAGDERLQAFGPIVSDLMSGAAELAGTTGVEG
jgi:hypothetical protein